ncbi:hypothetical protein [Bosea sp. PAMC 26642]|uniref:hypothetical protein n=1 Tax=Bosea sp. (strain PAMC 26642) TaxID=1792307 RepID=UPI000770422E|nr:hypothetical protein [Bosea sp. PAMC 26642]AMJ63057.1 hypothetical protein AXW83_24615 [Bosea sp. PAMC 26642]
MQTHANSIAPAAADPAVFMLEQLGFVAMHAGMAQNYLEAGDAPGFNYSVKSLTARVRAVVGLVNDLEARTAEASAHG